MSAGPIVAKADEQAWWVALGVISEASCDRDLEGFERGLELARKCRHPEAQWLCSLFPPGVEMTDEEEVVRVLEAQDERPLVVLLRGMQFATRSSCCKRQGWATCRHKLVRGKKQTTPFG